MSQGRKKEEALSIEKYPKRQILKDKKRIPMTIREIPLRENREKKKKRWGGQRISLMNMSMEQTEYRSPQRNTNSIAMIFRKYSVSFRICSSCK